MENRASPPRALSTTSPRPSPPLRGGEGDTLDHVNRLRSIRTQSSAGLAYGISTFAFEEAGGGLPGEFLAFGEDFGAGFTIEREFRERLGFGDFQPAHHVFDLRHERW